MQGTIKWFSKEKGYGFINSGEQDYYFNVQSIKCADLPSTGDVVKKLEGKDKSMSDNNIYTSMENILWSSLVRPHVCHSRLSGILLRSDSGQARMTEYNYVMWFYL